ncbi:Hpt domain-containing protein [Phascolarctobacterium faecium]|uniref:Hpt domain-containing protein n=1 Tax=Phascolarctobacterium faecium TaxID=33025 RepID=UPI003A8E4381
MDKFVQTELEGAGVNVEETLRRFMNNEMLMIKFLRKFVDDENMNKLRTLIADKHYNEVLPVAHTLKGVSGNLGLIKLYEIFSRMCQDCRNDQYEDLDGLFAQAEANYSKVVERRLKKFKCQTRNLFRVFFYVLRIFN